ncbi:MULTISPECIES: ABC transporter ATP-binding protein [Streptomyces]|uniref:ABC transporter ATP-binding protein n=2 Tax=Streptomyces TaxID=1883 RepID=A0A3R7H8G6_9ACTN|nr:MULTISPECIES: ABC transporter ATP-binding protein [Streptomyces]KNE81304.1 ABC transporter ATPase [Streptomyces fradiae]PQM23701.1 ABC transporter ATP-binding protein [Streptomyces xinghaiensis]RKM91689.1 ABC transporter ATP-binding protein [Streptomyces xinghaiensis]RNC73394.1 ABC transporter ATP-binding protein [Streptomyces xinghaiensis]
MSSATDTGTTDIGTTDTGVPARGSLRALLPALAGHRAMTARTCAAALLEQGSLVALTTLAAHTVGTAVAEGRAPSAATVTALAALVLVRALTTWREMDLSHDLAYRVLSALRVRVFDGLARSAPARVAGRRSGDLAATAMADVEALEFFYAHTTAQLLAAGTVLTGGTAVLFTVEPWLAAAVLPVAALLAVAPFADARGRAVRGNRTRTAAARLSADTVETVDGLRELLAFGALDGRRRRLAARGREVGDAQRAEATREAVAAAVRDLLAVVAVLGVVAAAARSVTDGGLHGPWVPAAMALALSVLGPVAESARSLSQAVALRAAAARVGAAVRAPASAPPPAVPRPLPPGPLAVRFHRVSFDYGGGPVLDGVELTVRAGETLALVGASGAGKSTCAHLLARFWDPSGGVVELVPADGDPVDIREVADAELRRAVALVGQETPLFHGTLAENLRLAAPEADDELLAATARLCGVDRIAPLDTLVGERGSTLSGGQRARIALARALLARPRVLVLDESTAHLDNAGDAQLATALHEESRTTIVIAHRRATIRRTDRIAVLEAGRITEEGTWDELAGRPGSALNRALATSSPASRP